jgi:ATP-dependent DNA helicase DinG
MLTDAQKSTIQQAYRQLLESKGHRPRYGQRLMIAEIARTLGAIKVDGNDERISEAPFCVVEAGTGTGKTIAYTLAVLPLAKAMDKKVVISTATVALQEQVVYRDLPDILRHSGLDFKFALAKGRGRYLCLSKLDSLLRDSDQPQTMSLYPDEIKPSVDHRNMDLYQNMLDSLAAGTWDGDRDAWDVQLEQQQWAPLTAQRSECTGRRCAHVAQCSFFKARENLQNVDCIVTNHDLVLSDLALGGGAILPDPAETIYIFDEGHHLPDRALSHFSAFTRLDGSRRWLDYVTKLMPKLSDQLAGLSLLGHYAQQVPPVISEIEQYLASAIPMLQPLVEEAMREQSGDDQDKVFYRFPHGELPSELSMMALQLNQRYDRVLDLLAKMHQTIEEAIDDRSSSEPMHELESAFSLLGQVIARLESQHSLWLNYAQPRAENEAPKARWLAVVEGPGGMLDIELNASPVIASNHLRQFLWSRCFGAIVTSATLTALGSFDRFGVRSGIPRESTFTVVPSPFDYSNATLLVPQLIAEPNQAAQHTDEIITLLPTLVKDKQGTLVLFTSRRQMLQVFNGLPKDYQHRILMQGDLSKQEIVKQHCKRVDDDKCSVIFGLASFAEGVDLPGRYCQHVIIARIPFAVPNDPAEAALAEWIEQRGGNPFMEVAVPDAAIKLIQSMGRLLRTEQDVGQITLLDKRIVSRRYGKMLLDSLPPFKRIIET